MDSGKLIRNLYLNLIEEMDDTDVIHIEMKEELLGLLKETEKQMDDNEYKFYRDKIFQAASVGEEKGFIRGFRYAFQLFLGCIKE